MDTDQGPRHYLYPLNPKSEKFVFHDTQGNEYATSYESFLATVDFSQPDEWGLATGYLKIRPNDFVWAYFAKPEGSIRAVGRVVESPHWRPEWERYAVWIRWDERLTKKLKQDPIRYQDIGQRVQAAAQGANDATRKVLDTWLRRGQLQAERKRDHSVTFSVRQVLARSGQPDFRAALMRVYNNRCAISGCAVEAVLEAAHIRAVGEGGDHSVGNGLLLRADLHSLFDRGLITILDNRTVSTDPTIRNDYGHFDGQALATPQKRSDRPSIANLRAHRQLWAR